ncbi:hypothetical protein [Kitasatospora cineracea]|uniref:Uncharacterized protein n=1 Tax=Kitasatospora cineracea TaxID=88074 RepID=A0A8G1X9W2_9ACTN|nr:hypothetical protein [Kitasatospora cineracea]ROR38175.1 hypothetical protein EDD39_6349 [Kitasatospora cineracea]
MAKTWHERMAEFRARQWRKDPALREALSLTRDKLIIERRWDYADAVGMPFNDAWTDGQVWALAQIHMWICDGLLKVFRVEVGATPGADKDREGNRAKLAAGLPENFTPEVYPGPGHSDAGDGILTWREDHFTWLMPLEIGYTMASRTFIHLHDHGVIARWPYGSEDVWVMHFSSAEDWDNIRNPRGGKLDRMLSGDLTEADLDPCWDEDANLVGLRIWETETMLKVSTTIRDQGGIGYSSPGGTTGVRGEDAMPSWRSDVAAWLESEFPHRSYIEMVIAELGPIRIGANISYAPSYGRDPHLSRVPKATIRLTPAPLPHNYEFFGHALVWGAVNGWRWIRTTWGPRGQETHEAHPLVDEVLAMPAEAAHAIRQLADGNTESLPLKARSLPVDALSVTPALEAAAQLWDVDTRTMAFLQSWSAPRKD